MYFFLSLQSAPTTTTTTIKVSDEEAKLIESKWVQPTDDFKGYKPAELTVSGIFRFDGNIMFPKKENRGKKTVLGIIMVQ